MARYISKSVLLLTLSVVLVCIMYPLTLWVIGQTIFPFQANGSLLQGPDGTVVGSRLIAQPFTKDEYFQPRPSAASYNASASASSALAPSNYALRDRVARTLGPIVKYKDGPKAGQLVAPDVEAWFRQDRFQGEPHLVAQWAAAHNSLAQAWVKADPGNHDFVAAWAKMHEDAVAQWVKDNPDTAEPAPEDLAVVFFEDWSKAHPGAWPGAVEHPGADGKPVKAIEPVTEGSDIQGVFFDMWRQEHPDVALEDVPGDLVTTSGSGLDPDITLENARYQLARVAAAWAQDTKRDAGDVRKEIESLLQAKTRAPFGGLAGVPMVNVLEVNLELRTRYGEPGGSTT
jgi:potassium-transporting ATPase KdpC subunit